MAWLRIRLGVFKLCGLLLGGISPGSEPLTTQMYGCGSRARWGGSQVGATGFEPVTSRM